MEKSHIDQGIAIWRAIKPDRPYEEHLLAQDFKRSILTGPSDTVLGAMIELMGFSNIDLNAMRAVAAAAKIGVPEALSVVNQMAAMYGSQHTFTP